MFRTTLLAGLTAVLLAVGCPAYCEDSSYDLGTVWEISYIRTEPGQYENYLDWLAKNWKLQNEFGRKEGVVVSYHVLSVNNPRANEADLVLMIEYKDYLPTAQRLELQKKFAGYVSSNLRKMDQEFGERKVMRSLAGSFEAQELKLK